MFLRGSDCPANQDIWCLFSGTDIVSEARSTSRIEMYIDQIGAFKRRLNGPASDDLTTLVEWAEDSLILMGMAIKEVVRDTVRRLSRERLNDGDDFQTWSNGIHALVGMLDAVVECEVWEFRWLREENGVVVKGIVDGIWDLSPGLLQFKMSTARRTIVRALVLRLGGFRLVQYDEVGREVERERDISPLCGLSNRLEEAMMQWKGSRIVVDRQETPTLDDTTVDETGETVSIQDTSERTSVLIDHLAVSPSFQQSTSSDSLSLSPTLINEPTNPATLLEPIYQDTPEPSRTTVTESEIVPVIQESHEQDGAEAPTVITEPEVTATNEESAPMCSCVCAVHKGPPAQKAPEPEKHLVHDKNDEVEYSDWMVAFYEHECGFDEWKSRQDEEEWIEKCRGADESRRELEIKAWKR
jgi:hypothetical protein